MSGELKVYPRGCRRRLKVFTNTLDLRLSEISTPLGSPCQGGFFDQVGAVPLTKRVPVGTAVGAGTQALPAGHAAPEINPAPCKEPPKVEPNVGKPYDEPCPAAQRKATDSAPIGEGAFALRSLFSPQKSTAVPGKVCGSRSIPSHQQRVTGGFPRSLKHGIEGRTQRQPVLHTFPRALKGENPT